MRGSVNGNQSTAAQSYSASVPLSVYRDLVAELQNSDARINELAAHNQQLAQENQILRQEIARVVQSFSHLQNLVDSHSTASFYQPPRSAADLTGKTKRPATQARPHSGGNSHQRPSVVSWSNEIESPVMQETFFIEEEEEAHYYPSSASEAINAPNWRLMISILLIILMGFGAGYLIVRPFFEHRSR